MYYESLLTIMLHFIPQIYSPYKCINVYKHRILDYWEMQSYNRHIYAKPCIKV